MNNAEIIDTVVDGYFSTSETIYKTRWKVDPGNNDCFWNLGADLYRKLRRYAHVRYLEEFSEEDVVCARAVYNDDESLVLVSSRYTFHRESDGALCFGEVSSSSSRPQRLFLRARRSKLNPDGGGFFPRTLGVKPRSVKTTVFMVDIPTRRIISVTWCASSSDLEAYTGYENELGDEVGSALLMFDNIPTDGGSPSPVPSKHTAFKRVTGEAALVFGEPKTCEPEALVWHQWRER
jgi:hypothetical protein